jgi:integrase
LSYAVDPLGKIASNPCEGIKQLYTGNRREFIWTAADITQLKAGSTDKKKPRPCPVEIAHAVDLAATTGLRLSDLLRLSWSHVGEDTITITTGKSKHRREAIIPLYDELRDVLARIPKRATTILINSRRRPWKANGFGTAFNRAKIAAGMQERTCTSMISAALRRRASTSPGCRSGSSPRLWVGNVCRSAPPQSAWQVGRCLPTSQLTQTCGF